MESTTTTTTDGIFRIVPADAFPPGSAPVIYVETDARPRLLIREGADLPDVVAELDILATHLVRHGIWQLTEDGDAKPPSRHLRHVS